MNLAVNSSEMQQELCSGHGLCLRISTTLIVSVSATDCGTELAKAIFGWKGEKNSVVIYLHPNTTFSRNDDRMPQQKKGIYKPKACDEIVFIRLCYCCQYYLFSANWRLCNTYLCYRCIGAVYM